MLSSPRPCAKLVLMKSVLALIVVSTLLLLSGCKPGPTTIVGSVSFRNLPYHDFPPAGHSGNLNDDVAYVRLLDNDGAGVTVWESSAIPAGTVITPFSGTPTSDEGEYIGSFVITLTDTQMAGLTMPLRIEAFLYDAPTAAAFPALAPGGDVDRYSYYSAAWEGDPEWFESFNILAHEVKTSNLSITMPFPP